VPAHAWPQVPQLLLSVPLTLIQPLVPQSVVAPVHMHDPFEQILPPLQSLLAVH
jgi:hypothetical protein